MGTLIFGVILWALPHWFKRLMPNFRNSLGQTGRIGVALAVLVSVVLMIIGYRSAPIITVWSPPVLFIHFNSLLMLIAFAVFAVSHTRGRFKGALRHPMLHSVQIWAVAHLLVKGDLASIILFGFMLLWATGSVLLINRAEVWTRPALGDKPKDILFIGITIVSFLAVAALHTFFGVWPFPGS
jgi:uncharacterized membrane protein